jgi:hypothetical protein
MTYERDPEFDALIKDEIEALREDHQRFATNARYLADKAKNLVALLDDAEVNHGSLIGTKTLRAVGELRLELAKWK